MKTQKHSCVTYFAFQFEIDRKKNAELLKLGRECQPEQIGIYNKDEVEQAIINALGVKPTFCRHQFEVGRNDNYSVYVSDMCRVTLKGLFGKERAILELKRKYNLSTTLEIVPYIFADSEEPNQCLSLDKDIVEFLYKTETEMDLDYYVY